MGELALRRSRSLLSKLPTFRSFGGRISSIIRAAPRARVTIRSLSQSPSMEEF
jgi:hypothetical protein